VYFSDSVLQNHVTEEQLMCSITYSLISSITQQQKKAEHFKYRLLYIVFHAQVIDLTPDSPVYSEDPPVQQRAEELNLLVYSQTDPVVSGVRGLISELKSEQQNLHL